MNKNTVLFVSVLAGLIAVSPAWCAEAKIVVVDMAKVMKAYSETKTAEALLEKQIEEFEAEQKDMLAERDKVRKEFEAARESARDKALSDKERESKMDVAEQKLNVLREAEMKIRDRMTQRQKEINDQKVRMQRRIVGKLREVIGKYAAEKGYAMVLDSAGMSISGVESVVYSRENMDITEDVLKVVNAGAPEVPEKKK
ncbi:MAG: hypothetical protein A2283_11420 [Lentisphaerae bacterium RIFOXYA12_FULL_48_11]|nr:MAG: hypothetical protein A2283_11420 [Lentisphaerae bacterium RIFOXYA12_FULL_48_11]